MWVRRSRHVTVKKELCFFPALRRCSWRWLTPINALGRGWMASHFSAMEGSCLTSWPIPTLLRKYTANIKKLFCQYMKKKKEPWFVVMIRAWRQVRTTARAYPTVCVCPFGWVIYINMNPSRFQHLLCAPDILRAPNLIKPDQKVNWGWHHREM